MWEARNTYHPELPTNAEFQRWLDSVSGESIADIAKDPSKWLRLGGRLATGLTALGTSSATGKYEELLLYGTDKKLSAQWETAPGGLSGDGIFAALTIYPGIYEVATKRNGLSGTIGENNAIITLDPGIGHKVGFGVSIGSQHEAEVYNEGMSQGWSFNEINMRISQVRNVFGVDPDFNIGDIRYAKGTVFASNSLREGGPNWLATGHIPSQVANLLVGREYKSFGGLKQAIWRTAAKFPELTEGLSARDIGRMSRGLAPSAERADWRGRMTSYQLHHQHEIRLGGPVYDLSNIRALTPRAHGELHRVKR